MLPPFYILKTMESNGSYMSPSRQESEEEVEGGTQVNFIKKKFHWRPGRGEGSEDAEVEAEVLKGL